MTVKTQTFNPARIRRQIIESSDSSLLQILIPADDINPLKLLSRLESTREKFLYWHVPEENQEFFGFGSLEEHRFEGNNRFWQAGRVFGEFKKNCRTISDQESAIEVPCLLFGGSFFPTIDGPEWKGFSPLVLFVPEWIVMRYQDETYLALHLRKTDNLDADDVMEKIHALLTNRSPEESGSPSDLPQFTLTLNGERKSWMQMSAQSIEAIRNHRLDKVVIGSRTAVNCHGEVSLGRILRELAAEYPSCTTFAFSDTNSATFFGSSPEWFVRLHGDTVYCDALAGTTSRSEDSVRDRQLGETLLHDHKNRSEHQYVVNYIREILEKIATDISINDTPRLQKLKNVQHLYTPFRAMLNESISPFEILDRLHPTPAVGGIPTPEAMQFIRKVEDYDRGYFSGLLGWYSPGNSMDVVVGLRSGLLSAETLWLYAGAGLVEDSDPAEEYDEVQLKLEPILSAINK